MPQLSFIILALLLLAMVYFVTMMAWRISRNVVIGNRFRESLMAELDTLRLTRMLAALGISNRRYTHQQDILDIRQQMANCAACNNTSNCDELLDRDAVDTDDIGFCANADVMKEMHDSAERSH